MTSPAGAGLARLLAAVDLSSRDSVLGGIKRESCWTTCYRDTSILVSDYRQNARSLRRSAWAGRSIREALKSLTLLGLVEVRRGDGTYLKEADTPLLSPSIEWGLVLSSRDVEDLGELRAQLAVTVAGLAAERRDAATMDDLRHLHSRMVLTIGNADRFLTLQAAFDARVAAAAANEVLAGVHSTVRSLLRGRMTRAGLPSLHLEAICEEYRVLLDALAHQDADSARAAAARHEGGAADRLRGRSG